ncbi:39S ribosomal protein L38, mitochondrial-like [Eriocheir sinensis]|uniref:39S ribosomal protein L38, mitochondrial-like n=1 Tax=Eriocheir sinensis TaxID=95602 RepID=UPI0021C5796A|nr:39S ribosomal protein L38, mitochondrial-like [Eriocheir sinensis]XP_050734191.1 39S ribosomal protein L38, mitochondrial-like [Eriocheir sinensis]XP_050734192.1 39S ribosomal protein L38, mitochondrial-like [Eriocheir sinensis]
MGVTRCGAVAAAGLLMTLLAAPRGSCLRDGLGEGTQSVNAALRFRHVLGVGDHRQASSLAPLTPRDTEASRALAPSPPAQQSRHSAAAEAVRRVKDSREEPDKDKIDTEGPRDLELQARTKSRPSPEAPRVPAPPEHLPPGLASRLKEFPSVAAALEGAPLPAPAHAFFEPRIQVEAEELSDEEWEQHLAEGWARDGLVPRLLAAPPPFLANVDFGDHNCVHLGNTLTPAHARAPPNTLRFPGEEGRRYTVMLLDVDAPAPPRLLWLLINVPPRQPRQGTETVEYEAPRPHLDTGQHRLVFLVYRQRVALRPSDPKVPRARSCQAAGRDHTDLALLAADLQLEGPTAANYFLSEWDVTVEHTCTRPAAA